MMHFSKLQKVVVQIAKCMCPNCKMYVQTPRCICPNSNMYLSKLPGKRNQGRGKNEGGREWATAWCCSSDLLPSLSAQAQYPPSSPPALSHLTNFFATFFSLHRLSIRPPLIPFSWQWAITISAKIFSVSMNIVFPFTVVRNVNLVKKSNEQMRRKCLAAVWMRTYKRIKWPTVSYQQPVFLSINSQSLEDTQVGYILQNTLWENILWKNTLWTNTFSENLLSEKSFSK